MPTYGYLCTECQHTFDVFQSMKEAPVANCPECSGAVKRLLYPVGVVFKGSGWYITDSRKPEKNGDGEGAKSTGDATGGESKSEPKSATKSETKTETVASGE
ncbi:MAG TPA: FmdB family zinc ribbon protein [Chthonomonadaceae bacterium]|nr:FmdB family zinc ribbon protein [Chthonomonadaceae bacterium]